MSILSRLFGRRLKPGFHDLPMPSARTWPVGDMVGIDVCDEGHLHIFIGSARRGSAVIHAEISMDADEARRHAQRLFDYSRQIDPVIARIMADADAEADAALAKKNDVPRKVGPVNPWKPPAGEIA